MSTVYTTKTIVTIAGIPSEKAIIEPKHQYALPVIISRNIDGTWKLRHITSRRVIDCTRRSEEDAIAAAIEYAKRLPPFSRRY